MPRIIVLENTSSAKQITLRKLPFLVGRAANCDLVIDSQHVSRTHAVFERIGETIQIRDLGGLNGTQVNGQLIKWRALRDGDEIKLGNCQIRFLGVGGQTLSDAEALRLVSMPGRLEELELRKLAPPPGRPERHYFR